MKPFIISLLFFLFLSSCDTSEVWFEQAQPEGKKELKAFPKKIQGKYVNCSNSYDSLIIKKHEIENAGQFLFVELIDDFEIDSNVNKNSASEMKAYFEKERMQISLKGDSVYGNVAYNQSVFKISEGSVLKKFRGEHFLNKEEKEGLWLVKKMNVKKDSLFIGEITPSDSLLNFDFVSDMNEEEKKFPIYMIEGDRKNIKKLIKEELFKVTECYTKVKQ